MNHNQNELLQQTISRPKYKRIGILIGVLITLSGIGIVFAINSKNEPVAKEKKQEEISLKNTDNQTEQKVGIADDILNKPVNDMLNNNFVTEKIDNTLSDAEKREQDLEEQARTAPTRLNNIASNSNMNNSMSNLSNLPNLPNIAENENIKNINSENDHNLQARKEKFAQLKKSNYYLDSQIQEARSKFELKAGSVIPAAMNHSISSDLPGDLSATVTQNVYDSVRGEYLLIPQGTKLNGRYDSQVAFGQSRIMVIWDRLVFADGRTFDLGAMGGADSTGKSGFTDKVNNHYLRTFGSAILVSVIGSGMQLSQPKGRSGASNDAQETITANLAQNTGNTAQAVLGKTLNVQPTLEINAGYTFNVAVNKDMVLE
jgi:type IV secretion system protein VirB10